MDRSTPGGSGQGLCLRDDRLQNLTQQPHQTRADAEQLMHVSLVVVDDVVVPGRVHRFVGCGDDAQCVDVPDIVNAEINSRMCLCGSALRLAGCSGDRDEVVMTLDEYVGEDHFPVFPESATRQARRGLSFDQTGAGLGGRIRTGTSRVE